MSKAPIQTTNEPNPDVMPEPIDDTAEVAAAVDTGGDVETDDGEAQAAAPLRRLFETDRERIVRLARERRDQEAGAANAETVEHEEEPVDEQAPAADVETPATAPSAAPSLISDDAEIELVVYGVPVKKKIGELKADAQKLLAADQKFDEAKRAAQEATELLKNARAQRGQDADPADQPDADGHGQTRVKGEAIEADQPDVDLKDEDLDSIVERIQVGDKDEGRQAIADLAKLIVRSNTSSVNPRKVEDIVRSTIVATDTKKEIDGAIERFNQQFPAIVKDEELVDVALRRVSKELREDLKAHGVSDDDLSKIAHPGDLARLHGEIRRKGANMRTYDAVLTAVGTHLQTKFGAALKSDDPAPAPSPKPAPNPATPPASTAQRRVEMKRAAQPQPRAAGARVPVAPATKPKTNADYVRELRAKRGFQ